MLSSHEAQYYTYINPNHVHHCTILIGSATPCDHDKFDGFGILAAALGHHDTIFFLTYQVFVCMIFVRFHYLIQVARGHKSLKG